MDRITRFSLKNGAAIVIVAILVTVGGLWSASQLRKESMPDVDIPYVVVVTPYPGAAPSDVYDNITEPMEKAVQGAAGVKRVRAQSGDSFSMVIAEFGYSQDMEKAEADVAKIAAGVKLPENAQEAKVSRASFNSAPILRMSITPKSGDVEALRSEVRDDILPALKGVAGVGDATMASDAPSAVRIEFDEKKLKKKGLTVAGVVQQLQAANLSYPVGAIDLGDTSEPIRVGGTIDSVKDIKKFKVAIYPDQNKLMGEAFGQIGDGMSALGNGMKQGFTALGTGMGSLGSMTGDVAMQAGLINGIQQLQGQMYTLKYDTLPQLKAAASQVPSDTPQYAQLQGKIAYIEKQALPGMQSAINGMQGKITASQKNMASTASKMKSSAGGMSRSSSARTSSSSLEPKIKVTTLDQVAKITYGPAAGTVPSRANGKPAALIDVVKTQDGNTVEVAKDVRDEMDRLAETMPGGATVEYVYDASNSINDSIKGMLREGLLGAIFAVVVILLFLRNWRATLIATISIPLSMLIAITSLKLTGVTLNVMTLGGLTVAIGRVVDDAIVVIENVFRHLQEGEPRTPETVRKAVAEVSSAITSSTLTTVAVFVPLGLVSGIIGKIFQPFAITVGVAMLASLLVAVTVVPLLARWFLLSGKLPKHRDEAVDPSALTKFYRSVLEWSLRHRAAVAGIAVALLVGSIALVPHIGTGFVPESKEKYLNVAIELPQGTKATAVDRTVRKVEAILDGAKEVDYYETTVGSAGSMSFVSAAGGTNMASIFVRLDESADTDKLLAALRKETAPLAGKGTKIDLTMQSAAGSSSGALEVVVTGNDLASIRTASDALVEELRGVKELENVSSNLGVSRPQIVVEVDNKKAAKYGMNAGLVAQTVRGLVAEQTVGSVKVNGQATDVVYETGLSEKDRLAKMQKFTVTTPLGDKIKLTKIASVAETGSPVAVMTRDGQQYASVSGHIAARDSGAVVTEVKQVIAGMKLPKGVEVNVEGQAEMMRESFSQLGLAMLIAIGLVYLVMIIAFGEAAAPLAIMMSLPLAVVGGLIGLFVAGVPLDMPAMIGALMLIGIVVTNAIVLVDRVRTNLSGGMTRRDALMEAGSTRMRPILMTAIATIMALVPLASGGGESGALISQSLAVIVIGGLTTSTLLTLIVVPVAYDAIEGLKDRIFDRKHDDGPAAVEPEAA